MNTLRKKIEKHQKESLDQLSALQKDDKFSNGFFNGRIYAFTQILQWFDEKSMLEQPPTNVISGHIITNIDLLSGDVDIDGDRLDGETWSDLYLIMKKSPAIEVAMVGTKSGTQLRLSRDFIFGLHEWFKVRGF